MGTPNVCNRCGNAYAGAFDNDLFCEHCKHDNSRDESPVKILAMLVSGLALLAAVIGTAVWLIGKIN